jgi:hypothetical protein
MPFTWDKDRAAVAGGWIVIGHQCTVGSTVITPDSVTWSLYDEDGEIVNSREDEDATPGETTYITLSGSDLPATSDDVLYLTLKVVAVIDTDYGNDLPTPEELTFPVLPLQND